MPENETSTPVASKEIEQPTDGAVDEGVQTETETPETAPSDTTQETQPKEESELLAGKYTSVDELVKGYQNATAEASRLAAEKAAYEKGVAAASRPATKTEEQKPQFTPEQLKQYKTGYLTNLADLQAARRMALKDGDYEAATKFEAQAAKAAEQIVLIDDELGKQERQAGQRQARQETARRAVDAAAKDVLRTYQPSLVQGTPFYAKAEELWQTYLDMGYPDSPATQAQAVLFAAELTGTKAAAAPETRKQLTQSINAALRKGVVVGTGKAKAAAQPTNFLEMSDEEFIKYKKSRGMD